jgi:hypothetical protein
MIRLIKQLNIKYTTLEKGILTTSIIVHIFYYINLNIKT